MCIAAPGGREVFSRSVVRRAHSSEGDQRGEQAVPGRAPGEYPAEVEGVELEERSPIAGVPPSYRRPAKHEGEGLAVTVGPVGDDVGNKPAVVRSAHLHVSSRGARDIETMHPRVAREDGVDQETVLPALRAEWWVLAKTHHASHQPRAPAPGPNSFCRDTR